MERVRLVRSAVLFIALAAAMSAAPNHARAECGDYVQFGWVGPDAANSARLLPVFSQRHRPDSPLDGPCVGPGCQRGSSPISSNLVVLSGGSHWICLLHGPAVCLISVARLDPDLYVARAECRSEPIEHPPR